MRIILAFLSLLVISSLAEEKTEEFNLRPGAPDRVSTTVDGVTCDFHYKTSGGTSELWIMTLKKSGGDVTCTISRPVPPSYLVFDDFSVTLDGKGATVKSVDMQGLNGQLAESEYSISGNKGENQLLIGEKGLKRIVTPGETFKRSIGVLEVKGKTKRLKKKAPKTKTEL
ncbi:hypothetical protein PROFUN_14529 [Planoprotostelium fungivorum]|uniref:Myeloid-derived growth factor n=1 Tax=Planoprotostelium fungivorum TaxID=1890364 RepID=A0A2P6N6L3_9EUKA|nr:hypothetical protein PROFUN_14529 [Planoprotostelium fungivorum]